jgi:hypothetical protein
VQGVFYYTTDGSTTNIYGVKVATGALMPPLDVYAKVVAALNFDDSKGQLIVAFYGDHNAGFIAFYPTDQSSAVTVVSVPADIPLGESSVYSSKASLYYNIVGNPSTNTTTIYGISQSGSAKSWGKLARAYATRLLLYPPLTHTFHPFHQSFQSVRLVTSSMCGWMPKINCSALQRLSLETSSSV